MERDGFVFYRSFYEAISCLTKAQKADCLDALARYALDGVEPEVDGIVKALFVSMKPQIDANNRRYVNGCKGGKPKANQTVTKDKPNDNQTVTKSEPKEKEKDKDKDKENVKDKDKEKENEKKKPYGVNNNVRLFDREFDMLVSEYGVSMTNRLIEYLDGYMEERPDYKRKTKSHYRTIKRWVVDAVKEQDNRRTPRGQPTADDFFADIRGMQ